MAYQKIVVLIKTRNNLNSSSTFSPEVISITQTKTTIVRTTNLRDSSSLRDKSWVKSRLIWSTIAHAILRFFHRIVTTISHELEIFSQESYQLRATLLSANRHLLNISLRKKQKLQVEEILKIKRWSIKTYQLLSIVSNPKWCHCKKERK